MLQSESVAEPSHHLCVYNYNIVCSTWPYFVYTFWYSEICLTASWNYSPSLCSFSLASNSSLWCPPCSCSLVPKHCSYFSMESWMASINTPNTSYMILLQNSILFPSVVLLMNCTLTWLFKIGYWISIVLVLPTDQSDGYIQYIDRKWKSLK